MVGGLGVIERDATAEPSWDWFGADDTGYQHWTCGFDSQCSSWEHRLRRDVLGVRHVCEMPCESWRRWQSAAACDDRATWGEYKPGMVNRKVKPEYGAHE